MGLGSGVWELRKALQSPVSSGEGKFIFQSRSCFAYHSTEKEVKALFFHTDSP